MEEEAMNKLGAGISLIILGGIMRSVKILAAAIYMSGSASQSRELFEAGMDYASYVEYGTYKMEAQPYFNDALEEGLVEGMNEWIDEIIDVFDQEAGEIGDNIEVIQDHMSTLSDEMDALESQLQELEAELMLLYDALDDCEDEEEAIMLMDEIDRVQGEMMAIEEILIERMNEYMVLWFEWGQWLEELALSEESRIMAVEAVASAIPPIDEGE